MSLTEHERRTLDEIEKQFHRQSSPLHHPRPHPRQPGEVRTAAVLLSVGLAAIWVSLTFDNAAGLALAASAYVLMLGSAAVLVDSIARIRGARAGHDRERPVSWNRKYLR